MDSRTIVWNICLFYLIAEATNVWFTILLFDWPVSRPVGNAKSLLSKTLSTFFCEGLINFLACWLCALPQCEV